MKKLQQILFAVFTFLCMTAIQSCSTEKTEKLLVRVNNGVSNIEIKADVIQDQKTFKITSKIDWTITAKGLSGTNGAWYTINAVSGKTDKEIIVDVEANPTGMERTSILTVRGANNRMTVTLKQAADGESMLVVSPESLTEFVTVDPATQTFDITTPFGWEIAFKDNTVYTDPLNPAIDADWASVDVTEDTGDKTITVTAKNNGTGDLRTGVFTITAAGKSKTVTVSQAADGEGMLVVSPESLTEFVTVDPATQTFDITTPFGWEIAFKDNTVYTDPLNPAIDADWASVDVKNGTGDKTITVTAKNNGTGDLRTGVFTITAAGKSKTVTVSQAADGEGVLVVSPESLTEFVVVGAPTQTFDITTPFDWGITFEDKTIYTDVNNPAIDADWASVDVKNGNGDKTITVTAKSNGTGDLRTGVFTITAAGKSKTVTVSQAADGENMLVVDPETLTDFMVNTPVAKTFTITTPFYWEITFEDKTIYTDPLNPAIEAEWASVDVTEDTGDKTITVTAKSNGTGDPRTGVFTITALGKVKTVTVNQITDLNHTFDPDFLAYCLGETTYIVDTNGDGSISKAEAEAVEEINPAHKSLASLKGIENFTALTKLYCDNNLLTELDLSANTELADLQCGFNPLTTINMSANTKLTKMVCSDTELTALDLSACTELLELTCYNNPTLAEINISGSSFEKLVAFDCRSIVSNAKIIVWNGFDINNLPVTSDWKYFAVIWESVL